MGEIGDNKTGSDDTGNTTRASILNRVFGTGPGNTNGESRRDNEERNSGTVNRDTGSERTGESNPQFTRPNTVESYMEDKDKPRTSRTTKEKTSVKTFVSKEACGNVCAGIADFISVLLTHSPILNLTQDEEKELGENLHETLSYLPATSPFVKLVDYIAPWAGLIHSSSKVVWKRVQFVIQRKAQIKAQHQRNFEQPQRESHETYAPDPSLVNSR